MNDKPTILIAGSVVGQEETIEPGEITGRLTDSISSQPLPYDTVALLKQGLIPFVKRRDWKMKFFCDENDQQKY